MPTRVDSVPRPVQPPKFRIAGKNEAAGAADAAREIIPPGYLLFFSAALEVPAFTFGPEQKANKCHFKFHSQRISRAPAANASGFPLACSSKTPRIEILALPQYCARDVSDREKSACRPAAMKPQIVSVRLSLP